MNINSDCKDCIKYNVCKYAENEVPEVILKVGNAISNNTCPEIIEFYVTCKEFERKVKIKDKKITFDN